jgi:AcrR family transcriptional regulator
MEYPDKPMDPAASTKREDILQAAEAVFEAHGYSGATVEAVAAEAGVAKGSVYNYFQSKDDLFRRLYEHVMQQVLDEMEPLMTVDASARQTLEAMIDYWHSRLDRHQRFGRLVLEFWAAAARAPSQAGSPDLLGHWYGQMRQRLTSVLARGVRTGQFRANLNIDAAASLILAIVEGIMVQRILYFDLNVDREFIAALKRGILAGLTTEPPAEAPADRSQP